jgi:integrase
VSTAGKLPAAPVLTVGELLPGWLAADHRWKPSTLVGCRSTVHALMADPVARVRVMGLSPRVLSDVGDRWHRAGVTPARLRVLRSAVGWAWDERILEVHPVRFMRGPGRVPPRRPLTEDQVRALLAAAELRLLEAHANHTPPTGRGIERLHGAEQDLLLVRLAADTGARRGELAALQIADLDGRVLRIDRAVSAGVMTTPKAGRGRVLTLGATTATLWHYMVDRWDTRAGCRVGPWVFTADRYHRRPVQAGTLGHRFDEVRDAAGLPEATLHRLRHSVATFLVARGQVLQAQARLGHADAATTLREYANALPLTDGAVADALDAHLNTPRHQPVPDTERGPDDGRCGPRMPNPASGHSASSS